MVMFDDVVGHAQSQAGAAAYRFGSEEGIKNFVDDVRGNARAGILKLYPNVAIGLTLTAKGEDASLGHGLNRIDHQIHEDLIEFRRIALDRRQFDQINSGLNLARLEFGLSQRQGATEIFGQIHCLAFGFVQAGEGFQIGDNPQNPVNSALSGGQQISEIVKEWSPDRFGFGSLPPVPPMPSHSASAPPVADKLRPGFPRFLQKAQIAGDKSQRIIDFMRHSGDQLAQGAHFFGVNQHRLGFSQFVQSLGQTGVFTNSSRCRLLICWLVRVSSWLRRSNSSTSYSPVISNSLVFAVDLGAERAADLQHRYRPPSASRRIPDRPLTDRSTVAQNAD